MSFTLSMRSARRPASFSDGLIQFFAVAFIYLFVYTETNIYFGSIRRRLVVPAVAALPSNDGPKQIKGRFSATLSARLTALDLARRPP